MSAELDSDDQAVYAEAFRMADAVHSFLARHSTQRVIAAGVLDNDVVAMLVESDERMTAARVQRRQNALARGPES